MSAKRKVPRIAKNMDFMKHYTFSYSLFAIFALLPSIANAETAYKWKDSSGKTFYGSRPPAQALNVTPIDGEGFSRYSTTFDYFKKANHNSATQNEDLLPSSNSNVTASTSKEIAQSEFPDPRLDKSSGAIKQN